MKPYNIPSLMFLHIMCFAGFLSHYLSEARDYHTDVMYVKTPTVCRAKSHC